jgi:hypothetical protein
LTRGSGVAVSVDCKAGRWRCGGVHPPRLRRPALSWRLGGLGQLVNPRAARQIRPAAVHGAPRCPSCVQYGDARSVRHGLVASGGSWDIRVHPLMRGLAASGARQWQVCDIFLH